MERTIYSDFDVNLSIHPVTRDVIKKVNENSVRQSLRLLIQTNFYDRIWQPAIGSNLNQIHFGLMDDFQRYSLQEQLRRVIEQHEPRVRLDEVSVEYDELGSVKIRLVYTILILDATDTFVYELTKLR